MFWVSPAVHELLDLDVNDLNLRVQLGNPVLQAGAGGIAWLGG
jgi:hypothetical protein